MGSGPICNPECQKILLCMLCAGYDLLAQDAAQRQWVRDGNALHPDFNQRQIARLLRIQTAIVECYMAMGRGCHVSETPRLKVLSDRLMDLSKPRSLAVGIQQTLIAKSEIMETLIDANQTDYLKEIGYAPQ